jgi:hypothetical protein
MRQHAFHFFPIEHAQKAPGYSDGCMRWVSTGCEGVRGLFIHNVELRNRHVRAHRQPPHHLVQARSCVFRNLPGSVHAKHDPIRKPVGPEIHDCGEPESKYQPSLPTESMAGPEKQGRQSGHQQKRSRAIHFSFPPAAFVRHNQYVKFRDSDNK